MAVTKGIVASPLGTKLVTDTLADSTAEANVTGATGSFYYVQIDNSENMAASFIKLRDATSATSSTAVPHWVLYAPASTLISYIVYSGSPFAAGLSFWGTSTADNATSQTDPAVAVTVRILST